MKIELHHYHHNQRDPLVIQLLEEIMEDIAGLKAAAARVSADLFSLKATVKDLADKLANIPVPEDNTAAVKEVIDGLNAAADAAEATAAPTP